MYLTASPSLLVVEKNLIVGKPVMSNLEEGI